VFSVHEHLIFCLLICSLNLQCGLGIKLCVSLRLETGLGSEISTWYQSLRCERSINISATKCRDFVEKRRYFTRKKIVGLCFN
jgi:hypothetical protein